MGKTLGVVHLHQRSSKAVRVGFRSVQVWQSGSPETDLGRSQILLSEGFKTQIFNIFWFWLGFYRYEFVICKIC